MLPETAVVPVRAAAAAGRGAGRAGQPAHGTDGSLDSSLFEMFSPYVLLAGGTNGISSPY